MYSVIVFYTFYLMLLDTFTSLKHFTNWIKVLKLVVNSLIQNIFIILLKNVTNVNIFINQCFFLIYVWHLWTHVLVFKKSNLWTNLMFCKRLLSNKQVIKSYDVT